MADTHITQEVLAESLRLDRKRFDRITQSLSLVVDELDKDHLTEEVHVPWDAEDTEQACGLVAEMCGHDGEHFELIEKHFKIIS
jgi:hypothetical protein